MFKSFTTFHSLRLKLVAAATSLLLASCGNGGSSAAPPTGGLTLDPGDGLVTINWAATSGVEYWLGYVAGASVSLDFTSPHTWVLNVLPPYVLSGLANGTTYAFAVNGRTGSGPGGAQSPSVATAPRPGGVTWTAGTPTNLGAAALRSVAYGTAADATINYVAVGDGGAVFKGTDGKSWSAAATVAGVNFLSSTYTLGKFFAAGSAGQIFYSTNMSAWTLATSGFTNTTNVNGLASNGSTVVAVGDNGTIRTSTDGITWIAATTVPAGGNLNAVSYAPGGVWIAVGDGGRILTSADGSVWVSRTSTTAANLKAIATQTTSVNTYVVVGAGGSVAKSTDAITWTSATVAPAVDLAAVVVPSTNSQFLAVGAGGAAYTSPDAITWTARTTGTLANLWALITAQVQYVTVGDGGVNFNSH